MIFLTINLKSIKIFDNITNLNINTLIIKYYTASPLKRPKMLQMKVLFNRYFS